MKFISAKKNYSFQIVMNMEINSNSKQYLMQNQVTSSGQYRVTLISLHSKHLRDHYLVSNGPIVSRKISSFRSFGYFQRDNNLQAHDICQRYKKILDIC